jgi:hypothetical protein
MLTEHSLKNQKDISGQYIWQEFATWKNTIWRFSSALIELKPRGLRLFHHSHGDNQQIVI